MHDSVYEQVGPVLIIKTTYVGEGGGYFYWLRNAVTGDPHAGSWRKIDPARRRAKQIAAVAKRETAPTADA